MTVNISVILTAYNRKEFLADALESLVSQTINKDEFQVIIISNFDYNVERYDTLNIKKIQSEGTLGQYLQIGVKESTGNILCFLDDDDCFHYNKLEIISKLMRDDTNYVKNEIKNFNKIEEVKEGSLTRTILQSSPRYFIYEGNISCKPSMEFNLSSISVRRDLVSQYLDQLNRLTAGPDTFVWFALIESGGIACYTPIELTYYRVHDSTSNRESRDKRDLLKWYLKMLEFYEFCGEVFHNPHIKTLSASRSALLRVRRYVLSYGNTPLIKGDFKHLFSSGISPSPCKKGSTSLLFKYLKTKFFKKRGRKKDVEV